MGSITEYLQKELASIFDLLKYDQKFATITVSDRPDLSQFQSNAAFEIGKQLKVNPKNIAEKIAKIFGIKPYIDRMEIAGPGFINFILTDTFLIEQLKNLTESKRQQKLGVCENHPIKTTLIDFCGANVAKPMHVGHLRSAIIGDGLAKLARHLGDKVITDNHIGDWGLQMGLLIAAVEEKHPEWSYFDKNFSGDYPADFPLTLEDLENLYPKASDRAKKDHAFSEQAGRMILDLQQGHLGYLTLWQNFVDLSKDKMNKDLSLLGINFDFWRGESYYQPMLAALVRDLMDEGLAIPSQGATIMPLSDMPGLEETPPLILLKSDGASLYHTTDLATLISREQEFKPNRVLYVVDQRQSLHFKQIFAAAKKIGLLDKFETVEHIGFGTVNGKDGRPYKTREGGVMKLADLINLVIEKARGRLKEAGVAENYPPEEKEDIGKKVGLSTLKFADLVNNRLSDYTFDLDKFSKFEGRTGPYILYTAVRIQSILRKAEAKNVSPGPFISPFSALERNLILELLKIYDVYLSAYHHCALHFLCEYLFKLCKCLNAFYLQNHVLGESDIQKRGAWLSLLALSLDVIKKTLEILGIEVPDRM